MVMKRDYEGNPIGYPESSATVYTTTGEVRGRIGPKGLLPEETGPGHAGPLSETGVRRAANPTLFLNPDLSIEAGALESDQLILPPKSVTEQRGETTLDFELEKQPGYYINLMRTRMYLRCKVVKKNGENLAATDHVAPVNCIGAALFSKIVVRVEGRIVAELGNDCPGIDAWVSKMLSTNIETGSRILGPEGWTPDDVDNYGPTASIIKVPKWQIEGGAIKKNASGDLLFDLSDREDPAVTNKGYYVRRGMAANSNEFEVFFKPPLDFLDMKTMWPDSSNIRLTFVGNSPNFYLMSEMSDADTHGFKIKVLESNLEFNRQRVSAEALSINQHNMRKRGYYQLPFLRSFWAEVPVEAAAVKTSHNIVSGRVPAMIVGMITNTSTLQGTIKTNPYDFNGATLKKFQFNVASKLIPQDGFRWDFSDNKRKQLYKREYKRFRDNLGMGNTDLCNYVTPNCYDGDKGQFLPVVVDFTSDLCAGAHRHLEEGTALGFTAEHTSSTVPRTFLFKCYQWERILVEDVTGYARLEEAMAVQPPSIV